jgi:hypothetical protein
MPNNFHLPVGFLDVGMSKLSTLLLLEARVTNGLETFLGRTGPCGFHVPKSPGG